MPVQQWQSSIAARSTVDPGQGPVGEYEMERMSGMIATKW